MKIDPPTIILQGGLLSCSKKSELYFFSFLICICPLTFSGCSNAPAAPADSLISSSSEAETATTQPDTNSHDAVNLAIVLPGLDSANWQKIATAARNACKDAEEEFGCPINLIVQGPAGESDAEGYIACLENVIASEDLDGLIVASLIQTRLSLLWQKHLLWVSG